MIRCCIKAKLPLFLLVLALFPSVDAFSASGAIKFQSRLKDFGTVNRGEVLRKVFSFENKGKGNLRIKGVYASCGCTVVNFMKDKIYKPGEVGEIEIVFRTEAFIGRVRKTVSVMTNEKGRPDRLLNLKVNLIEEFSVSIPLADFGDVSSEVEPSKMIVLSPIKKFPLEVSGLEFDEDKFKVKTRQDGKKWVVTITLKNGQKSGFLKENIVIVNNSRSLSKLTIPVRANIVGNFRHTPFYVEFGSIGRNDQKIREIQLSGLRSARVSKVSSSIFVNGNPVSQTDSYIKIGIPDVLDVQKTNKVAVTLNNISEFEGSVHGFVKIVIDDPSQKEIKVPFFAFFR